MAFITAEELQEIVNLANSVPEEYRQKCFELLLSRSLEFGGRQEKGQLPLPASSKQPVRLETSNMPIDVKAFFNQHRLDLNLISTLFHIEGTEVRPIYTLSDTTKVKAEINLALLIALETALRSGQFQVEIETLRTRCQEQKCYDMANFMRHIKNNSRLFKTITTDQPLSLSVEGKAQLGELLKRLGS